MSNTKGKTSQKRVVRKAFNSKKLALAFAALLVVAVLVITGVYLVNSSSSNDQESTSVQKVERTVSGKSVDEDRRDVLEAATNILKLAEKSPTGAGFESRLVSLDSGDMTVIDPELKEAIRFQDVFAESKDMQINTYQSIVTLSTLIKQASVNQVIEPTSDTMWKNVYVDSELGTAFVPLAIYAGPSTGFSFEMVYVDGEWKLAPYSLLDAVKLSANLQSIKEGPVAAG